MPQTQFRQAALILDYVDETGGGWTDVATKLGIVTAAEVYALRFNLCQSPSTTMIRTYFETPRQQGASTLDTLETLHGICDKLDTHDARVIFENVIREEKLVGSTQGEAASLLRQDVSRTSTVSNKKYLFE